jgi:ABC-type Fe3+-hydroxamate transport system substrate-binding protein
MRPTLRPDRLTTGRARRPSAIAVALLAVLVGAGACSGGGEAATAPNGAVGTDERVVVIGEEYLLADLLALGVTPVASTATVAEEGFHAVGDHDTSGIRVPPALDPNVELLASLEPDHIIILEFFADQIGRDVLEAMAEVTDENGRAYLSEERLDLLSAPRLLLLQSPLVEGEARAIDEVEHDALWRTLPAVEADRVAELDRLGYPGIEGRIRLVDDLTAALAPAT